MCCLPTNTAILGFQGNSSQAGTNDSLSKAWHQESPPYLTDSGRTYFLIRKQNETFKDVINHSTHSHDNKPTTVNQAQEVDLNILNNFNSTVPGLSDLLSGSVRSTYLTTSYYTQFYLQVNNCSDQHSLAAHTCPHRSSAEKVDVC